MQSVPPPDAPPPVVFNGAREADAFFSKFPCVVDAGVKKCILGLNVAGRGDVTDTVQTKLTVEGWKSEYIRDRTGRRMLSINTEGRSLEETAALARRFQNGEFGSVEMQVFAVPVPGSN